MPKASRKKTAEPGTITIPAPSWGWSLEADGMATIKVSEPGWEMLKLEVPGIDHTGAPTREAVAAVQAAYPKAKLRYIDDYARRVFDDALTGPPPRRRANPAEYGYGAQFRPVQPGFTVPRDGFLRVEPTDQRAKDATRHGVVVYDRPLTSDELDSYQLLKPLTPPEAADHVAAKMTRYATEYIEQAEDDPRFFAQQVGAGIDQIPQSYLVGSRDAVAGLVLQRLAGGRSVVSTPPALAPVARESWQARRKRVGAEGAARTMARMHEEQAAATEALGASLFKWSARAPSETWREFSEKLADPAYASDVRHISSFLKQSETSLSLKVPATIDGATRYAIHSLLAHDWKARNRFDEWAAASGGLDAD